MTTSKVNVEMYVGHMDGTWGTTFLKMDVDPRDTDEQIGHQAVQELTDRFNKCGEEVAFIGVYHFSRDEEA